MKRVVQCVILAALCSSLTLLTGCWNYRELENNYIVSGMAIDEGKQGHRYHVTFEVLDVADTGQNAQMKGKLLESEGDTIADAVDNVTKLADKELFYSNCKVIIFSRQIAKDGMTPVLEWINRDPRPRITAQAFVSLENTAGELFLQGGKGGQTGQQSSGAGSQTGQQGGGSGSQASQQSGGQEQGGGSGSQQGGGQEQGGVISMQIASSMESTSTGGESRLMHIYDVDNVLLGEGEDLALPCLKKSGKKSVPVQVNGTAVFRGDRCVGFLDDELTQDYLFAMNNVENSVMVVGERPSDNNISLLIRKCSVSVDPEVNGGKILMRLKIKLQCSFEEENSQRNYLLDLGVKQIENFADNDLREHIGKVVRQMQTQFGCDIFGFGRRIYQEKPKEWSKLKASWPEKFRSVSVDVEPEVTIINTGLANPKGTT